MIALHNLDKDKLEKVIERGGFICPSIALTTEENCLSNFDYGDITVIFSDNVIDPNKNKDALLLSGDGFTCTFGIGAYYDQSNEEIVEMMKEEYFDEESFMYNMGENICKSAASVPITMEQAEEEIYRIIPMNDYIKYKRETLVDEYESFLDKNFKGWDWDNTEKQYLFRTKFLDDNSIRPSVEIAFKAAIKACSKEDTLPKQRKAVRDACKQYGLKVTPKKVDNIIEYTKKMRNAPIVYFEEKIFQTVPLTEIKGLVIPEYLKDLIGKLQEKNIPFKTYSDEETRKKLIIDISNGPSILEEKQSLESIINKANQKVEEHNTSKSIHKEVDKDVLR